MSCGLLLPSATGGANAIPPTNTNPDNKNQIKPSLILVISGVFGLFYFIFVNQALLEKTQANKYIIPRKHHSLMVKV